MKLYERGEMTLEAICFIKRTNPGKYIVVSYGINARNGGSKFMDIEVRKLENVLAMFTMMPQKTEVFMEREFCTREEAKQYAEERQFRSKGIGEQRGVN
jgi:putative NADPH-quinone reductase